MSDRYWNPYHDCDFSMPKKGAHTCFPAEEYEALLQEEYQGLDQASLITVNQLKIFTSDKFFEYQWQVSQLHTEKKDSRPHRCVAQIYGEYYQKLLQRARKIAPPPLVEPTRAIVPAAPPPERFVDIPGVEMGEFTIR